MSPLELKCASERKRPPFYFGVKFEADLNVFVLMFHACEYVQVKNNLVI